MKKIYKEIAEELNVPASLIEKIVNSQFEFVKKVMAEGEKNKQIADCAKKCTKYLKFLGWNSKGGLLKKPLP